MKKSIMKKNGIIRAFAFITAIVMMFTLVGCKDDSKPLTKDAPKYIESIVMKYNGETIRNKQLQLRLGTSEHKLTTEVKKVGEISAEFTFASSNSEVVTVSDSGDITLKKAGEVVISATSTADASKTDYVVVTVVSDLQQVEHDVTVIDGTANAEKASEGTIVTITPDRKEGHKYLGWSYSIDSVWKNGNTFEMPGEAITVTATYETLSYNLTLDGATIDSEATTVLFGTEVTLVRVAPPEGKKFLKWNVSQEDLVIVDDKFVMPSQDLEIKAVYENIDYTIEVTNGQASKTAVFGEKIDLVVDNTIIPKGQILIGWKGIEGAEKVTYGTNSFDMPSRNLEISPVIAKATNATLSRSTDTGPSTTAVTNGTATTINDTDGVSYPLDANTMKGYVMRIRGGGIGCDVDKVAYATFRNDSKFEIVVEFVYEFNGDATRTTGDIIVPANGQASGIIMVSKIISEKVEAPYAQLIIKNNIGGTSEDKVNIGVQVSVATCEEKPATSPVALAVTGGTYKVTNGSINNAVYEGDEVILTPTLTADYRFKSWKVSDESVVITNNKFTMPAAPITIEAVTEKINYYSITVNSGSASKSRAEDGEKITLVAVSIEGKVFVDWSCTDSSVVIANNSFTMPAQDVTLTANYKEATGHTVTVTDGSYTGEPIEGGTIHLTVDPAKIPTGKMLVGWSGILDDNEVSYGVNKFVMPNRNVTVAPIFAAHKAVPLAGLTDWGAGTTQTISGKAATHDKISGFNYSIPANKTKGSMLRIRGGGVTTDASKVAEVIFINNGKHSITIEFVSEYLLKYLGTTGEVTIGAGETVICYMYYSKTQLDDKGKFAQPYMAVMFLQDIGGTATETLNLSIFVREATI